MSKYSKEWRRLREAYPAIERVEPETISPTPTANKRTEAAERSYTAYLKRKAQAEAARYLAQKEYDKSKPSKVDWLAIVIVSWVCFTILYMAKHNLT
jgi:hypothetical protein